MWTRVFWVIAGYILFFAAPKAGPAVSKTYGMCPLTQGAVVHVQKMVGGIRDGRSCNTGWADIGTGIRDAKARGLNVVEVCDSAIYAENVMMDEGLGGEIRLISRLSGSLPQDFTYQDVQQRCGETGIDPFPTISGTVSFLALTNPTAVQGFIITNPTNSGVICNESTEVSIVANCIINNNSPGFGGGIATLNCPKVIIDRNVIVSNRAAVSGGGISSRVTGRRFSEINSSGNLLQLNTAEFSGGAIHGDRVTIEEHRENDLFVNTALKDFGGGGAHFTQSIVNYIDCEFLQCDALEEGGGGLYFSAVNESDLQFNEFTQCAASANRAGDDFDPLLELLPVSAGGGGIHFRGGNCDTLGGFIDSCSTKLDGGGILYVGLINFPRVDEPLIQTTGTIIGTDITLGSAFDDGGGFSNQIQSTTRISALAISQGVASSDGGGIHGTCASKLTVDEVTVSASNALGDGGGSFFRNARIIILESSPETQFIANHSDLDGGGMVMETNTLPGIPQDDPIEPILTMNACRADGEAFLDSVVFAFNSAAKRAGALAIKRFKVRRSITFLVEDCFFIGNVAENTTEAAVEVRLTSQPGAPASGRRSRIKDCFFFNTGVQLNALAADGILGGPVNRFWDLEGCTFDLSTPSGVNETKGVQLGLDTPTIKSNIFAGPVGMSAGLGLSWFETSTTGIGIDIDRCLFKNLRVGADLANVGNNAPASVSNSFFQVGNKGLKIDKLDCTTTNNTFSDLDIGIEMLNGSSLITPRLNTFNNVTIPIDTTNN